MDRCKSFGEFISAKRFERCITVRAMAERIGVSPGYYSDIEKNRRNPPDREILKKIIAALGLGAEEEIEFFDLAGKARSEVSPDLPDYIMGNDVVRVALRIAKQRADSDDWRQFIENLEKKQVK